MSTKKQMVLTFLFDTKKEHVLLMRRDKPDNQKGRLNGIGGAILEGEPFKMAAYREFAEAGYDLLDSDENPVELRCYGVFSGADYEVYCFVGFDDVILNMGLSPVSPHFLKTPDEKLQLHHVFRVVGDDFNNNFVSDVSMLSMLALSDVVHFSITYKN